MATINSIQKGTVTIANGAATNTATISAITVANSFALMSYSYDESTPNENEYAISITNTTTIKVERKGTTPAGGATITIYFTVIEYSSGVTVQSGSLDWSAGQSPPRGQEDITLTAVTVAQSWPYTTRRMEPTSGFVNDDDFENAEITTTTNLQLQQLDTASEAGLVQWQVIDNDDVTAQSASPVLSTSATGTTGTITAVDLARTFLSVGWETGNGGSGLDDKMGRAKLTSTTAWTFNRKATGSIVMNAKVAFVEQAGVTVQSGEDIFTTTELTRSPSLTSLDTSKSFVISGGNNGHQGSGDESTTDNFDSMSCEMTFTATVLTLTRVNHRSATLDFPWYVVEEDAVAAGGGIQVLRRRRMGRAA